MVITETTPFNHILLSTTTDIFKINLLQFIFCCENTFRNWKHKKGGQQETTQQTGCWIQGSKSCREQTVKDAFFPIWSPICHSQWENRRWGWFYPHPSPSDRTVDRADSSGPTAPPASEHSHSRHWPQTKLCLTAWEGLSIKKEW